MVQSINNCKQFIEESQDYLFCLLLCCQSVLSEEEKSVLMAILAGIMYHPCICPCVCVTHVNTITSVLLQEKINKYKNLLVSLALIMMPHSKQS